MSPATCRKRGVSGLGQSEGKLGKRQKEADDQQQSSDPAPSNSIVLQYRFSQRVHVFIKVALLQPREVLRSCDPNADNRPSEAGA